MRIGSLFVGIAITALMLISPATAVDTDGDGLLDLLDVPGFDPNASGEVDFWGPPDSIGSGVQDLDGANQLTNAQSLTLRFNSITSIERGDFDGLTNLQSMDLRDNQITSIESGAFRELASLETLDLRHGEFSVLNLSGAMEFESPCRLSKASLVIPTYGHGDYVQRATSHRAAQDRATTVPGQARLPLDRCEETTNRTRCRPPTFR